MTFRILIHVPVTTSNQQYNVIPQISFPGPICSYFHNVMSLIFIHNQWFIDIILLLLIKELNVPLFKTTNVRISNKATYTGLCIFLTFLHKNQSSNNTPHQEIIPSPATDQHRVLYQRSIIDHRWTKLHTDTSPHVQHIYVGKSGHDDKCVPVICKHHFKNKEKKQ